MIILKLKQPFDPGMFDQGNTYPHVLVTTFNMAVLENIIDIRWEYGTLTETGWQSGKAGMPQQTIVQNDDFYAAISAMPAEGSKDSILMAAARECYDILTKSGAAPGDVVEIDLSAPTAPSASSASSSSASTDSTASSASSDTSSATPSASSGS